MDNARKETLILREIIDAAVENVVRLHNATGQISSSSTAISAAAEELSISITHIADQSSDAEILTSATDRNSDQAVCPVKRLEYLTC